MKLTQCKKVPGHFYDANKYKSCPHCVPDAESDIWNDIIDEEDVIDNNGDNNSKTGENNETDTTGGSLERKTKKDPGPTNIVWEKDDKTELMIDNGIGSDEEEVDGTVVPVADTDLDVEDDEDTLDVIDIEKDDEDHDEVDQTDEKDEGEREECDLEDDHGSEEDSADETKTETLKQIIKKTKTHSGSEDTKTIIHYDFATETLPIVGWLVCIKGEYLCKVFELHEGRNTIGRNLKMDVSLAQDRGVSRDKHAIITYEPKRRKFYIQPGEGSGLTYLNDDILLAPCEIKDYDIIQVGNSELILRTFCSESFAWEDHIN